jgi:hypothetical protein
MPDSFQLDQGVIFRGPAEWSGMRQVGTVIRCVEVLQCGPSLISHLHLALGPLWGLWGLCALWGVWLQTADGFVTHGADTADLQPF